MENPGFLRQFRNKFCIGSSTLNVNLSIELKKIEHSNNSGKESQKRSEESESLLPGGDHNILRTRNSESGNSLIGADISSGGEETSPSASPFNDVPFVRSPPEDTVLKKEISSEDTNVKTSEPEPTSNVPNLHVDSFLSGGNKLQFIIDIRNSNHNLHNLSGMTSNVQNVELLFYLNLL